jgi:hypothetical protein
VPTDSQNAALDDRASSSRRRAADDSRSVFGSRKERAMRLQPDATSGEEPWI